MKWMILLLCSIQSWALTPHIGDAVEYKRTIQSSTGLRTVQLQRKILSYDKLSGAYQVSMGKNEGSGWKFWVESLLLLDYSYGLYSECEQHLGVYKVASTAYGATHVCERRTVKVNTYQLDWHAEVPFGLVKHTYKDPEIEFETILMSYRFGGP